MFKNIDNFLKYFNLDINYEKKPEGYYYQGHFLGKKDNLFAPSFSFLSIAAKNSKKKLFVDEKREQLFLYGKNVFLEEISRIKQNTGISSVDGYVLVQNMLDENLGMGKIMRLGGRTVIKNLLNRGQLLKSK